MKHIGLLSLMILASMACTLEESPPNVILVLVDDLGFADLHCYGNDVVETPHIDRLAAEGVRFTSAYASCTVCSPTRAALLTGKNPTTLNITDWIPGHQASRGGPTPGQKFIVPSFNLQLPHEEITIAEMLRANGYRTASIGKWHLGGEGYLPTEQGFDLNIAGNHKGSPPSYHYPYLRKGRPDLKITPLEPTGDSLYLTDRLTNEAIQFIRSGIDDPFFLYLPFYNVHTPIEGRPDLVRKYEEINAGREGDTIVRNPQFLAMIHSVDENLGRIMKCLEEENLDKNTLVIFTSDNGGLISREGPNIRISWNYPFRRGKGTLYEGGHRVPAIVRWPDRVTPGRISDEVIISTDIFPTIMEIAGINFDHPVEGVSLLPHLTRNEAIDRETLYWHYPHYHRGKPGGAIRVGDLKLIEYYENGDLELYDLKEDPGETTNLFSSDPNKAFELQAMLEEWRTASGARMPLPNPDYTPAAE